MPDSHILYITMPGPLGKMILGSTDAGICFIEWTDNSDIEDIKNRMFKKFGMRLRKGGNKHLERLQTELKIYFDGKLDEFSGSLDIRGTDFEMTIWNYLLKIPYGQTRSYGEIARAIGKPGASRAVGHANGANLIPIIIPCHRVINSDGKLGGYAGELWRKKYLLELESGMKPSSQNKLAL
jgi:O-6-methylguanine DNA methyltransferase